MTSETVSPPDRVADPSYQNEVDEIPQLSSRLDALNLILSAPALDHAEEYALFQEYKQVNPSNNDHQPYVGGFVSYQNTMSEMRSRADIYRKGYLSWRRSGAKGARGEVQDVFGTGFKKGGTALPTPLLAGVSEIPFESISARPMNPLNEGLIGSASERDTIHRPSGDGFRSSWFQTPGDATVNSQTPEGLGAEILVSVKDRDRDSQLASATMHERQEADTWLRFYYTPFTPLENSIVWQLNRKFIYTLKGRDLKAKGAADAVRNILVPEYPLTFNFVDIKNKIQKMNHDWDDPNGSIKNGSPTSRCSDSGSFNSKEFQRELKDVYCRRDPVDYWIVHLGVGNFHRSHQCVFLDDVNAQTAENANIAPKGNNNNRKNSLSSAHDRHKTPREAEAPKLNVGTLSEEDIKSQVAKNTLNGIWGICGFGIFEGERKMFENLLAQDFLYTVLTRSSGSHEARVVGAIRDFMFIPDHHHIIVEDYVVMRDRNVKITAPLWLCRLVDEKTRILSLTITEKGYCQNIESRLDVNNPLIIHDLKNLNPPSSAIGLIVLAVLKRIRYGVSIFTIMSCDNLPENGSVARTLVRDFAAALASQCVQFGIVPEGVDAEDPLTELPFILDGISFPATMVDRITPVTSNEHKDILSRDFGISDNWPVVTEEFKQWVIEDDFPIGRPDWETAAALTVPNVRPFELMKLRLLNGGHSFMCYLGVLSGYRYVDDALSNVQLSSLLRAYMDEVTSTIKGVSIELERYKEKIVERFSNKYIKDTLGRICEDGSTKFYNTMKDAVTELVWEQRHTHMVALGVAGFMVFASRVDSSVLDVPLKDPKDDVVKLAENATVHPQDTSAIVEFLSAIFGPEVGSHPVLSQQVQLATLALRTRGAQAILRCGGVLEALCEGVLEIPGGAMDLTRCIQEIERCRDQHS